jgi:hypothetical protein
MNSGRKTAPGVRAVRNQATAKWKIASRNKAAKKAWAEKGGGTPLLFFGRFKMEHRRVSRWRGDGVSISRTSHAAAGPRLEGRAYGNDRHFCEKAEALAGPELAKQVATRIASRIDGAKAGEDGWFTGWRVEGPFNTWSMTVEADEPGRVVLEGDVPKWDIMRKAVEAAANVPGIRVVDSELEYEPDYYPIFRYGAERYYDDGYHPYYPYYPYLARPPYAAPVQPAPMARKIRPAPPVPGDGGA